jgi:hypothetical protein
MTPEQSGARTARTKTITTMRTRTKMRTTASIITITSTTTRTARGRTDTSTTTATCGPKTLSRIPVLRPIPRTPRHAVLRTSTRTPTRTQIPTDPSTDPRPAGRRPPERRFGAVLQDRFALHSLTMPSVLGPRADSDRSARATNGRWTAILAPISV